MKSRIDAYRHSPVPYGDDNHMVRGVIARCPCGAAVAAPLNTLGYMGNPTPELELQAVQHKLKAKGWHIGRHHRENRCPRCITFEKGEKKMTQTPIKVAADNTRQLTRDDRRIVFEKLNAVYIDGAVGYSNGWTDEKLATDLGVPRSWVRLIREENFGDAEGNEEIRGHVNDAKTALDRIRVLEPEMRQLLSLADKIEKDLAEIMRVLK